VYLYPNLLQPKRHVICYSSTRRTTIPSLTKYMLYASNSISASNAAPCIVIGVAVAAKHHVEVQASACPFALLRPSNPLFWIPALFF
jgi:hypothetical protein